MPKNTITLVLDGKVSLAAVAKAVGGFSHLVTSLQDEVAHGQEISWTVESLEVGSAIATFRGDSTGEALEDPVGAVVDAYEQVGAAVAAGNVIPFGPRVAESLNEIIGLDSERIESVRFETAERDAAISLVEAPASFESDMFTPEGEVDPAASIGVVTGRVQSISSRGGLRFTIYDLETDKAVSCYLKSGMEESMRDAWGKIAAVRGVVKRDARGRPLTIRQVDSAVVEEELPSGAYAAAVGVLRPYAGEQSPEDAIRRMRDDA